MQQFFSACSLPTEPSTRSRFFGGSSSCWNLLTPTIIRLPFFNVHLPFVSGILNFFLDVAFSDSFRSAAEFINFLNVIPAFSFDLIGQSFYIVGTAQRVNGVSQAGFVSNDLLSTQSDGYGFSGRQSQSFVFGVGVQGLGTTHYCSCGFAEQHERCCCSAAERSAWNQRFGYVRGASWI